MEFLQEIKLLIKKNLLFIFGKLKANIKIIPGNVYMNFLEQR